MSVPMLFANVGWMNHYAGRHDSDPTLGGHRWLGSHRWGHEAWNFKPYKGNVYGYVPGRSARSQIRLENMLGATRAMDTLVGVTVVFIARHPRDRKTYIVGWYRNAAVHRSAGHATLTRTPGVEVEYQILASANDATLLPEGMRGFVVPTAKRKGNLGQSPLWYGGTSSFRVDVLNYIGNFESNPIDSPRRGRPKSPRQNNAELRKEVERQAIEHAKQHFSSRAGYSVRTVEQDRVGWDLEATSASRTLKIEVKGLLGNQLCVELTPNEYEKMQSKAHRDDYVVYVVTSAVSSPKCHVFYHAPDLCHGRDLVWVTESRKTRLVIEQRTGARLTSKRL
jgi:hypothetical protein